MEQFRNIPIESLPRTRPLTIQKFKSIGINTYWDLLNYFPFRYENYSLVSTIRRIQLGETVTVKGRLEEIKNIYTKSGLRIQRGILADETGRLTLTWYNQPYLLRFFRSGQYISVAGEMRQFGNKLAFEPKEFEVLSDLNQEAIHTARLVPVYSEKNGLSTKTIREKVYLVINHLSNDRLKDGDYEIFSHEIVQFNNLIDEASAYQNIHFPKDYFFAKKAQERLGFDELFVIQLSASLVRKNWNKEKVKNPFNIDKNRSKIDSFIKNLPFVLTKAQKRVVEEILTDLGKRKPMNRFLEGDVGSGKTVVAAIASYVAYLNGTQSLIMAPTEILALQHFKTVTFLFREALKVALVTSSIRATTKDLEKSNIIIGTHSLIQKKLNFKKVGLVVIDEQHRFGVAQRAQLKEKGINPHLLTMTATPIPRTTALTLYGELDLSVIDEMPVGRLPIKTYVVPRIKRESGYLWIKEQIKRNKSQVFIVCPLIEESEVETMKSMKAASVEYERLRKDIFPEFKIGLLHGKVKSKEKETIMQQFKKGEIDILVATPVVEVGIDIPNATIMLIEAAERFGLAQLHQLRGRVGRGEKQSYCLLYSDAWGEKIRDRLSFFSKNQSGLKIAEYDFKMRGPGDIFGTQQHGIANLKIASLTDFKLIEKAKLAVHYFFKKYTVSKFSEIEKRLQNYQVKQISRN